MAASSPSPDAKSPASVARARLLVVQFVLSVKGVFHRCRLSRHRLRKAGVIDPRRLGLTP